MPTSSRGSDAPTVRLAFAKPQDPAQAQRTYARIKTALGPVSAPASPVIRLAHTPGAQGDNNLIGQRGVAQLPRDSAPALLVSFVYLDPFLKARAAYRYRDWALDSGAFSAMNSGTVIDLDAYIRTALRLRSEDPTLSEVFSLDVIGDWRATIRNTERMWRAGVQAVPTFHRGTSWDVLVGLARDYPKVALGGIALAHGKHKERFASECFARVWPKKIHGFGFGTAGQVMKFPFHSVDATNWEVGACKFGRWRSFGYMSVRGSSQNLRAEVEYYLALERRARSRWAREMARLEE